MAAFAGKGTAARWDELEETGSLGCLAFGLEGPDDGYHSWVAAYRLALSAALRGSDDAHWDATPRCAPNGTNQAK